MYIFPSAQKYIDSVVNSGLGSGITHGFYCLFIPDPLNSFSVRELHLVNECSFALSHKFLAFKSLCSFQGVGYSPIDLLVWPSKYFF